MMQRHHPKPTLASERAAARRVLADLFPEAFEVGLAFDLSLLYAECGECGRPLVWPVNVTRLVLKHAGVAPESLDYSHLLRSNGCAVCSPELTDPIITLVRLM
ncbi:hypothetical protein [Megalodesulfovibrio gigas]|uniref:Uncharacterized protein n=1 Tax=Megalodesulfovibrio gigas (strain ATCC 19364 / DSM 1382 / NCIMB 9332 / VKM B-1759) TaxID=1121448 RepID=T2G8Z8_MEGG1|nr:hypothetical protein [Megalodesulfovibrio gigas]AGW12586.1 hypothetical protein DGI_0680 [Megalodesulfovibrio gigas DSM 1382 = ATCC 19364]